MLTLYIFVGTAIIMLIDFISEEDDRPEYGTSVLLIFWLWPIFSLYILLVMILGDDDE